jgi:hypothetical protein
MIDLLWEKMVFVECGQDTHVAARGARENKVKVRQSILAISLANLPTPRNFNVHEPATNLNLKLCWYVRLTTETENYRTVPNFASFDKVRAMILLQEGFAGGNCSENASTHEPATNLDYLIF